MCSSFANSECPGIRSTPSAPLRRVAVAYVNEDAIRSYGIPESLIAAIAGEELAELERREREYRGGKAGIDLRNRIVILVDDGLATGSSMRAAVQAVRAHMPARVVVAVPVGAVEYVRGDVRHRGRDGLCPDAESLHGRGFVVPRLFPDHRRGSSRSPGRARATDPDRWAQSSVTEACLATSVRSFAACPGASARRRTRTGSTAA